MVRNTALALALLWGTAGVAYAGLFSDDEAHRKIDELKRQSAQQIQGMDERMAKMESQLTGQGMVDMLNQLETLKTDLNKLRGQLEVQMHELETTQKRQKDLYADLDTRLRNLEVPGSANAAVVASSVAQQPATSAKGVTAQAAPTADPAESVPYDAALNLFKVGNYKGAIAGFQAFLKSHPASGLAASAQYWIGNSHFAQRDYKAARDAQRKLLEVYPNSQKVPDAMLNLASCQMELGDSAAARKTLEELVAKFPVSSAAELAQKRLGASKK